MPPDPRSLCPLSSTEFVEPPSKKIPGYATARSMVESFVISKNDCFIMTDVLYQSLP